MDLMTGIDFFPESKTIFMGSTQDFFSAQDLSPIVFENKKIAPWGEDNDIPQKVLEEVSTSEILSANLNFNRDVAYGLGPKVAKMIRDKNGKVCDYIELEEGREYDFFESNDIPMFLMSMLTDMVYFHNAFAELIPDSAYKEILVLRHKEAAFSRWGLMNKEGVINSHYYSAEWDKTRTKENTIETYVLDEFNAIKDIEKQLTLKKNNRLIFPSYMPSPGRPYYSVPGWYSIFNSGWYDHLKAIPILKKAILKNNLGVRFIVYISEEYWDSLVASEGIKAGDFKAIKALKEREKTAFQEFLSGSENASKAIMAIKNRVAQNSGTVESKQVEIIPIDNKFNGGEYISDLETASAMMSYATNVHPSLIGATLSKSAGSMGGTDKRELFLIKQAIMKPVQDRVLRIIRAIIKTNKWSKDTNIIIPEYIFTTLDQNKKGKEESNNTTA